MKKLILILLVATISCNKQTVCECNEFVTNSSGVVSSRDYYVRSGESKRKAKNGSCSSYTVSEIVGTDYVVTKRDCYIK